jgi:hypothetical protein
VTQPDVSASAGSEGISSSSTRSAISHAGNSRSSQVDIERAARHLASSAAGGSGAIQLGELEEVDVRAVFAHDGDGFSNWLAANLDRLAKELGISGLRDVGRDIGVGSFTVDILAQTDKGRRVAITNQLEASDHMHLGQVVTFAAGLDLSAVIWITTKVTEEHRAVLDWLNSHSDDDVRFFAVELRLLRIGSSLPAAVFNAITKPNDWQKVARQRQRVSAPFNSRMREF